MPKEGGLSDVAAKVAAGKILGNITDAVETLIDTGKDHHGLFPSILDRETGKMLEDRPPSIPGQRDWDRAHDGSNLIHDQPLLRTMYALGTVLDRRIIGSVCPETTIIILLFF